MYRDLELRKKWEFIKKKLGKMFASGDDLHLDSILFLIGIQQLGQFREFSKQDKINLMHIAVCCLLQPYGYYRFSHLDKDGWPHYVELNSLPPLKPGEQTILIKEAIVGYFESIGMFDDFLAGAEDTTENTQ